MSGMCLVNVVPFLWQRQLLKVDLLSLSIGRIPQWNLSLNGNQVPSPTTHWKEFVAKAGAANPACAGHPRQIQIQIPSFENTNIFF